jgi:hypothetical protein
LLVEHEGTGDSSCGRKRCVDGMLPVAGSWIPCDRCRASDCRYLEILEELSILNDTEEMLVALDWLESKGIPLSELQQALVLHTAQ